MHSPIPRFVRWTVALTVICALSVAGFQYWGRWQYTGWTQTQWGPLGPADRDLLVKVRQAGLWEGPTGQQAQQRATSVRVREVGRLIATEHADLDARVRDVSARLGVALPNQPSDQQQGWITEITNQTAPDFDRTFIQRLRAAHGKVLPVISQVRAGTRNELIRKFAVTSAEFVTRHHEYLESTGLVDYTALDEPPTPATAPPAAAVPPAAALPLSPAAAALAPAVVPAAVDHGQHLDQVAGTTPVNGAPVLIAVGVYSAGLLAIIGLLSLLGTTAMRARRARPGLHRAFGEPGRSRHAASALVIHRSVPPHNLE